MMPPPGVHASCDLDLWPPDPQSWSFHAFAPRTTYANLHRRFSKCGVRNGRWNERTDGRTNKQTDRKHNIMPPSRGSVCLHGWGITSHDWVFIFLNFSLWPHVFPSECANFPMWIHDQLYVRCLAEYPTDTFLFVFRFFCVKQQFNRSLLKSVVSRAATRVKKYCIKQGTHILYVCLTIAIVLAVYLQNFNMFLRNMLL